MTIEEYLRQIRVINENLSVHMDDPTQKYLAAQRDLIDELLDKLSEFEHEVTLREVMEMCGDCSNCPYPVSPADPAGCFFNDVPGKWNIDDIQKRMKEAQHE